MGSIILATLYPALALLSALLRHGEWDGSTESLAFLLPPAVYLASCFFALLVAHRLEFHKYNLPFFNDVRSVFLGCLLFWIYCFPRFLFNWRLVAGGRATIRQFPRRIGGWKNGFTFITLAALWNVGWVIAGAVAIPSCMESPARANSRIAMYWLARYHAAQRQFASRNLAAVAGNTTGDTGYCDNFRNLHYGLDAEKKRLDLIPVNMADAFAGPTLGTPVATGGRETAFAFNSYLYLEDSYVAENNLWADQFGLVAYPRRPGRDGFDVLWIGTEGEIFRLGEEDVAHPLTAEQSPLHPECSTRWVE